MLIGPVPPLHVSLERDVDQRDIYQLLLGDEAGSVSTGPFAMTFASPGEAFDWFRCWTSPESGSADGAQTTDWRRRSPGDDGAAGEIHALALGNRVVRFDEAAGPWEGYTSPTIASWLRNCPHRAIEITYMNTGQERIERELSDDEERAWLYHHLYHRPPPPDPCTVTVRAAASESEPYFLEFSNHWYALPIMGFSIRFASPTEAARWLHAASEVDVDLATLSLARGGTFEAPAGEDWPHMVETMLHCAHELDLTPASGSGDPARGAPASFVEALVGPGGQDVFALRRVPTRQSTRAGESDAGTVEYRDSCGEWTEDIPRHTPQWAAEQVRVAQLYPSGSEPVPSDVIDRSACYRIQPQYSEPVADLFDHEIALSSHFAFLLTLDPAAEIERAQLSGDQRRWVDDLVEQWRGYLGPEPEDDEVEPGGEQEYLWQHLSYLLDWTDSPSIPFTGADLCDVLLPVLGVIHGDGDDEPPEDAAMRWGPGE